MRTWLKASLVGALVVGASWAGVVWYWRANHHMPATGELAGYLLVLPLALLGTIWLARTLSARLAAAPEAAVPATAREAPPLPQAALSIVAGAVRAAHGASAEELSAALEGKRARPSLDPELVDDDGYPVMAVRVDEADDETLQEEVLLWLGANDIPDPGFNDEQWRALALGSAVAAELANHAACHSGLAQPDLPTLQLLPLLPHDWAAPHRRTAGLWLEHLVSQAGWPRERIALGAPAADAQPAQLLSSLSSEGASPVRVAIVLACGSHIGDASVGRWDAGATLFNASHPQGLIPGEGAAGLLLADALQAQLIDAGPHGQLHGVRSGMRDGSADAQRPGKSALLGELARQSLQGSTVELAQVALVVADTGHRTTRVMELMALVTDTFPQLELGTDVIGVGASGGSCGAVTFMTALTLAHYQAQERAIPVLCIGNEDPYHRCAALILPAPAAAA